MHHGNRFHLTVRVHSDNARGKQILVTASATLRFRFQLPLFDVTPALSEHTRNAKWNLFATGQSKMSESAVQLVTPRKVILASPSLCEIP